jgi:uncharacterized membrane-anchored protein YhcB (DUF1043 family)
MRGRAWFVLLLLLIVGVVGGWTIGSLSETKRSGQPVEAHLKEIQLRAETKRLEREIANERR